MRKNEKFYARPDTFKIGKIAGIILYFVVGFIFGFFFL